MICNRSTCSNEVVPAKYGPPKTYCSENCRWLCSRNPTLRRAEALATRSGLQLVARVTAACTVDEQLRIAAVAADRDISISEWARGALLAVLDAQDGRR